MDVVEDSKSTSSKIVAARGHGARGDKAKRKSHGEERERSLRSSVTADKVPSSAIDIVAIGPSRASSRDASSRRHTGVPATTPVATSASTRPSKSKAPAGGVRVSRNKSKASAAASSSNSRSVSSSVGDGAPNTHSADAYNSGEDPPSLSPSNHGEESTTHTNLSADDEGSGENCSESSDPNLFTISNMESISNSSRENGDELNESGSNKSEGVWSDE